MDLSNEQINILKIFYEHKKIPKVAFPNYSIDQKSSAFQSIRSKNLLELTDPIPSRHPAVGYCNLYTAYRITSKGEAVYENYLEEKEEKELYRRDIKANERNADQATKANIINIFSVAISVAALIISIVALCR